MYPTWVDISGELAPSVGSQADTVARAFGGDAAAYTRATPLAVLAMLRFPRSAALPSAAHHPPTARLLRRLTHR